MCTLLGPRVRDIIADTKKSLENLNGRSKLGLKSKGSNTQRSCLQIAASRSHIGAQLLVADGLLQALSIASGDTSTADRERFVTETYRTLRNVRNSAVQANNSNIDEIFGLNASETSDTTTDNE